MACPVLEDITAKFNSFTEKPVKFLAVQSDLKNDIKNLVKSLYDYTKTQETVDKKVKKAALPEMIVQDFDEEQIWQQIELQNTECWDQLVWDVANCMSSKTNLEFPVTISKEDSNEENNVDSDKLISEDEEHSESEKSDQNEDEDEINEKPKKKKTTAPKSKGKSSIVDDQFFKLQDMEKFLLHEERNEGKKPREDDSDEESIDLFNDIDDDDGSNDEEGGKEAMYSDFFNQDEENGDEYENGEVDENGDMDDEEVDEDMDAEEDQSDQEKPPKKDNKKKVKFALADSSSDDDDDSVDSDTPTNNNKIQPDEKKSEFEQRQLRLKQQIEKLEQKTLSEAPWQLKGEVDALKRPQNSLLEEVVDFDLTSRPPPIITEQTTVTLEELIRRRIKDKAWDDVEKKEKPVDDQLSFRKNVVLDHAKSKLSLAQVYEAEYLKQKQAASGEVEEEKEPEAHTEIRDTMNKLFAKLDALCHYHYTPKAPQAEVKIVSNTPAISMEEVAPVATSDATLLAPEEVKRKRKGELMSKEERTQTDKNRERRKKKKLQRQKGKVAKVTEHRNTEKGAVASCPKTSKAFFEQLTNDSRSLIKKNNVKNKGQ